MLEYLDLKKVYKISFSVSGKSILLFGILLIFLLFGTVISIDLTESEKYKRLIAELAHIPAFFILAIFLLSVLENIAYFKSSFLKRALVSLFVVLGFSVATEIIQPYFGRDSSFHDFNLNFFGAALGLSFEKVFSLRNKLYKLFWFAFLFAGLIYFVRPIYLSYQNSQIKAQQFPVLAKVSSLDVNWWKPYPSKAEISFYDNALNITTYEGVYSGIFYEALGQKWSPYDFLELEIFNPGEEFILSIRVDDQNETTHFGQRFDKNLRIKPGRNLIKINIDEIREGPTSRILDMERISSLHLFTSKDVKDRDWLIKRAELKLEP